jgi:hypothetical protein
LEDGRIVNVNDQLLFSCTSLEHSADNRPRICWATLDEDEKTGIVRVKEVARVDGYKDNETQKNWLPYVTEDNSVRFVYNYNPFVVLQLDRETCQVSVVNQLEIPIEACNWRGSSGPVLIPGEGYLLLVHEVCDRTEGRHYMHRFVLMDATLTAWKAASDLFYFKHGGGVEMATGLVYDKGMLYISIGIEDHEAYLLTVSAANVLKFINEAMK